MRLLQRLDDGNFSLVEYFSDIPRYAILSHTWLSDSEEVTFKDVMKGRGKGKEGYKKLQFCAQRAARDGLDYFWVDTCCIDKSSSAELSEAINSMFYWYQRSERCYVYMSDVSSQNHSASNMEAFRKSRWFTRGWTLQELIAPSSVIFFSVEGERLGDRNSLLQNITDVTGIPDRVLQGRLVSFYTVAERMSWAINRNTKRQEDAAYSLMGLFDVHMTPIYGEGKSKAFKRLKNKIVKAKDDTVHRLVWSVWPEHISEHYIPKVLETFQGFLSICIILVTLTLIQEKSYWANCALLMTFSFLFSTYISLSAPMIATTAGIYILITRKAVLK